jgi:hypothetical protein
MVAELILTSSGSLLWGDRSFTLTASIECAHDVIVERVGHRSMLGGKSLKD